MGNSTIQEIEISRIHAGDNDRKVFKPQSIRELADSIAEHGLLEPVHVRPAGDGFELIAGERRFRAHQLLQSEGRIQTVRAIVEDADDAVASDLMLIENLQREDLDPIDEAKAYAKRMREFGLTDSQVAARYSVAVARVRERLELLDLREDVQHLVRTKQMPLAHAAAMHGLDSNRQGIAMEQFCSEDRPPVLAAWRRFCGGLLVQQQQESMFGDTDFMQVETIVLQSAVEGAEPIAVEIDPKLPEMKGMKSTAEALALYRETLAASDDPHLQQAALVVGNVIAGLMKCNCLGSRPRKLRPGETGRLAAAQKAS